MRVHFWGVRGSVPWATRDAIGHGCNTPCLELTDERTGEMLILDAGSGIVGLGERFNRPHPEVPILLTHYHWDHLQGLPFFSPLYEPTRSVVLWAPNLDSYDVAWVETIFRSPFFPIPYDRLPARPGVQLVTPGEFRIGSFEIRAIALNHPGGALAYRIRGTAGDLVYATDHEIGEERFDRPLASFVAGASALIFDAHFTPEEGPDHRGWGHSTWEQAAVFARANRVERLWLFHHKPGRSDWELTEIKAEARKIFPPTEAAGEGDSFKV